MHALFSDSVRVAFVLLLAANLPVVGQTPDAKPPLDDLIKSGKFAAAEQRLRTQIGDPAAPITSDAAIRLEILRRTRYDFSLDGEEVLAQVRQFIPDATGEDIDHWREAGDLRFLRIDGEDRYFRRCVSNLFRFNAEAQQRRGTRAEADSFDLTAHLSHLVNLSADSPTAEVFPVRHRIHYEVTVPVSHPRVRTGSRVRAWLPFPQEYRQQKEVRLIRSEPTHSQLSDLAAPQRTIYFEQVIGDPPQPPHFAVDFEFITSAYCPRLRAEEVQAYDTASPLYKQYTSERIPHIAFTPQVKQLVAEIVGEETNPLKKTLRIFRWVSQHVPWCAEVEYSIIPNLSAQGLTARQGDCGVQGMTFVTLCRAAGIPARWQSGWQTRPGEWNMHDWSEFYIEPWGWLPADASYGVREHADPRVRDFLCGHIDPYRLIVNLDYGRDLQPPTTGFRSEPNDFQRGEIEIDGYNLYFDEWDWKFGVETIPIEDEVVNAGRTQD